MKYLLILLILLFFDSAFAGTQVLSLERYLELVKKEDLEIKRYVHQRFQARFQKNLSLPDSRWVLSLTNLHGISTTDQPTTRRTEASLGKNFRSTGTEIEASYNTNTLADRQEEIQSVQLRQSLLRNFFGQQVRAQEEGLDLRNQVTLWQLVETYEDYLAEKLGNYLDFVSEWQNHQTAEQQLKEILLAFMLDDKKIESLVDGGYAPLGAFSSRITACYAFGLITPDEHHDLHQLRKIRNDFAHGMHTSFETQSVIDRCATLRHKAHDYTSEERGEVVVEPSGQFRTAAVALIMSLTNRAHYVRIERRTSKSWPY